MLSRDEKRRRIYSMVFLYLVHNNVAARLRDLYLETSTAINECKARALELLEAQAHEADYIRLREPSNWGEFQTHVVQRAFRTVDAFVVETNEFIGMTNASMSNLVPRHMDFITHARTECERALQDACTDAARESMLPLFDLGAFLSIDLQHPLQPVTAPLLRDAIRAIDAVKVAQLTLENREMNSALALRRVLENELQKNRRSVEVRSVVIANRVEKDYLTDGRLRERVVDSTDDIDRVVLTWSAAHAQRWAVYVSMRSLLDLIQGLRAQVNDAVVEVLQDDKYGGEMILQLIMANDEHHEVRLQLKSTREQEEADEEAEEEEAEQAAHADRLRSFAEILGNYADDNLRALYEQTTLPQRSTRSASTRVIEEQTQEDTQARLERIFRPAQNTGALPALPVRTVRDAIDAVVNELVSNIAARRLQVDADDAAAVHASATVLLGFGNPAAASSHASRHQRKRPRALTQVQRAAQFAASEVGFSDADPDLVAYTNAELLRVVMQRDMLVQTMEERIFNCIVSPSEIERARQSPLMTTVRETRARMRATQRQWIEQNRAPHLTRYQRALSAAVDNEDDAFETPAALTASVIAARNAARATGHAPRARAQPVNAASLRIAGMMNVAFTPRSATSQQFGYVVRITSTSPQDRERDLERERARATLLASQGRAPASSARTLIVHRADQRAV